MHVWAKARPSFIILTTASRATSVRRSMASRSARRPACARTPRYAEVALVALVAGMAAVVVAGTRLTAYRPPFRQWLGVNIGHPIAYMFTSWLLHATHQAIRHLAIMRYPGRSESRGSPGAWKLDRGLTDTR